MHRFTRSLVLLFLIHNTLGDPNAPCYFPSGDRAQGYFPCDADAYIVQCCPTGWTCYSNSLCVITDPSTANATAPVGTSIRGTCTDPKWVNPICGEYCLDEATTDAVVEPCGNNTFCCASDQKAGNCKCSDGTGVFSLGTGIVQTIIGVQGLTYTATPIISASNTAAAPTLSTTVSTTGSTTGPATSTAPAKKGLSTAALAGIGAGGGVAVLAVLIGALMLCSRARRQRLQQQQQNAGPKAAPVQQTSFLHQFQPARDADTDGLYGSGGGASASTESL